MSQDSMSAFEEAQGVSLQGLISIFAPICIIFLMIIALLVFKALTKKKSENFIFNGFLIIQFIFALLSYGFAYCTNGPTTKYALEWGLPIIILEKIIGMIASKKEDKKPLKIISTIGVIIIAILIVFTGRFPPEGNIPLN